MVPAASQLLRLPGLLEVTEVETDAEALWPMLERALNRALKGLAGMRREEGRALAVDLAQRMVRLKELTSEIEALAPRQKPLRLQLGINQTIVNEDGMGDYSRLRDYLKPLGLRNNVVFGYDESATYHTDKEISIRHDSAAEFNPFGNFGQVQLKTFFGVVRKDLAHHSGLNRPYDNS